MVAAVSALLPWTGGRSPSGYRRCRLTSHWKRCADSKAASAASWLMPRE
jgi:hypothetical protein